AFAEMEQFIDTPVKRYSSGMYVKLAFAVAAHLDNEILIMDEVLAVGDMKFQQKCLGKMDYVSRNDGRTILFVSHNMNLISQLCDRCILLENGQVVFDGNTQEAIDRYLSVDTNSLQKNIDLQPMPRPLSYPDYAKMIYLQLLNPSESVSTGEPLPIKLTVECKVPQEDVFFRFYILNSQKNPIGIATTAHGVKLKYGKNELNFSLNVDALLPGTYYLGGYLYQTLLNLPTGLDRITTFCCFVKDDSEDRFNTPIVSKKHGFFNLGVLEMTIS
ncbi:MAG: polysaccharide ABC transporter ATP-binding protein, partial [Bacillota bacterium]